MNSLTLVERQKASGEGGEGAAEGGMGEGAAVMG